MSLIEEVMRRSAHERTAAMPGSLHSAPLHAAPRASR